MNFNEKETVVCVDSTRLTVPGILKENTLYHIDCRYKCSCGLEYVTVGELQGDYNGENNCCGGIGPHYSFLANRFRKWETNEHDLMDIMELYHPKKEKTAVLTTNNLNYARK